MLWDDRGAELWPLSSRSWRAVRQGLAEGKLKGNERLPAEATVTLAGIDLSLEIKGEIDLDE
jgi:hypothetical protein